MKVRLSLISVFLFYSFVALISQSKSVVSLAPSITKMVYLLEAQDNLDGCTAFCEEAKADGKEVVASQMSVNVEKILNIEPEVVLTTNLISDRDLRTLRSLGLNVKVFDNPASFDEICDQFIRLGEIFDKKDIARNIVKREKERLNKITEKVAGKNKPGIFVQLGVKPLWAVIPGTFMNDYIKYTGGYNITADLNSGAVTRETVLVRNPDVIIIVLMGIVGNEEKQNWLNYQGLKAEKNNKILLIDADKACSPTPVTFVDIVEEIIKFVYLD